MVEKGEWADDRDEDGGVGTGCLAFESGGSAKRCEAEESQRHREVNGQRTAAMGGLVGGGDAEGFHFAVEVGAF